MVMIADMGDGGGPGSVQLTVRPEKLREAAKGFAELADDLEVKVLTRLSSTVVQPCGTDAVSTTAAAWYNHQINGGAGSGYWAIRQAVANLRESARALAVAADRYDEQNQALADALDAGPRA